MHLFPDLAAIIQGQSGFINPHPLSLARTFDYFEAYLRQCIISQIFLNVYLDIKTSIRKRKKKHLNYRLLQSQRLASSFLLISSLGNPPFP